MKTIIQQITPEMVEKINKKAFSEELSDLDKLAAELFEDCAQYILFHSRSPFPFLLFFY